MVFHIFKDSFCNQCKKLFIPVKKQQVCGYCGGIIEDIVPMVDEMADDMRALKRYHSSYIPPQYGCCSSSDEFLLFVYQMFDVYERDFNGSPFEAFLTSFLNDIPFGENLYLRKNIKELALALHEKLR